MKPKVDLDVFAGGVSGLIIGPPKTGKSTLLGSICEIIPPEEVVLICLKPSEVNSHNYVKYGLAKRAKMFTDLKWRPAVKMYEANGFQQLVEYLVSLYEDTKIKAILMDPFTDAVQLAAHEIMAAENAESPRDMRDSIAFYGSLRYKLRDLVQTMTALSSPALPQPKHVFVSVHAQPTKESDIKGNDTSEKKAKGVSYFGDVLPMIEGGYRQDIAGEFDMVGFTSIKHGWAEVNAKGIPNYKAGKAEQYVVQFKPDTERHAGVRLAPALEEKEFPNHLPTILGAVVKSVKAAA